MENNKKPIYPKIDVKLNINILSFTTYLRKKHNKKWYEIKFYEEFLLMDASMNLSAMNKFNSEIYNFMILGIISENLKDINGDNIFILSDNQEDEYERLKKLLL